MGGGYPAWLEGGRREKCLVFSVFLSVLVGPLTFCQGFSDSAGFDVWVIVLYL